MFLFRIRFVIVLVPWTVWGFEVFSEQQILQLNPDAKVGSSANYNNSELGSTHIDDYWTKIDVTYSPLEGWNLIKYVRIGCFEVRWSQASSVSWAENTLQDASDAAVCTGFCNGTQAYLRLQSCRCANNESDLVIRERDPCILGTHWEIFRHFDYRSQMQPTAYDVARRFLYQLVSIRMDHVTWAYKDYIHAINVFENKPVFQYDTRLDRTVFNSVWDFRKSRLVALSWYPDEDAKLYFTVVTFHSSSGELERDQKHTLIQDDVQESGVLLANFASVEGMGTVDILYGTYYTVVPAEMPTAPNVVHVVVAIDIDRSRVLNSVRLPVTLMNMQINALEHVLYGAGMDLTYRLAYYKLCNAIPQLQHVDDIVQNTTRVACELNELGELPAQVNQMYLQSASIDHHHNTAWFAYKTDAAGPPLILEYHQTDSDYVMWRDDSLPREAVYSSLIQTAPRIIFVLYPPSLEYVRFNAAGTKIFLQFTASTLQGAIPQDGDGDEIPDYWNEADKKIREPCEVFLDDFTMEMLPGSICQWVSDSRMFIEVSQCGSTIMPGDLVRVRANRIYAGRIIQPGNVAQFSQPSTDFKAVEVPEGAGKPTADISGYRVIDSCTELILDGTGSKDFGYRGTFKWTVSRTEPAAPMPHMKAMTTILNDEVEQDPCKNPHVIRIPKGQLQDNYKYYFDLKVTSLWGADLADTAQHVVQVSPSPIPPLSIFGPSRRPHNPNMDLLLSSQVELAGCLLNVNGFTAPVTAYTWKGCLSGDTTAVLFGMMGCSEWHEPLLSTPGRVSGIMAKTLKVGALTLAINTQYVFTVKAELEVDGTVFWNYASVIIDTTIGNLDVFSLGGNGFAAATSHPLVINLKQVEEGCFGVKAITGAADEPMCQDAGLTFTYACTVVSTGLPCDLGRPGDNGVALPDLSLPDLSLGDGGDSGIGGGIGGGRRLGEGDGTIDKITSSNDGLLEILEDNDCNHIDGSTFKFRGETFQHADKITTNTLDKSVKYCMSRDGVLIMQAHTFGPGMLEFDVNMTKMFDGVTRIANVKVYVQMVVEESPWHDGKFPQVSLGLHTVYPVVPSRVIRLVGEVTNPQSDTMYKYSWSIFQWAANPKFDRDQADQADYEVEKYTFVEMMPPVVDLSDPNQIRTPSFSRYLAMQPWVLSPGMYYRFRLDVTDVAAKNAGMSSNQSYAEFIFKTIGLPPSGGKLSNSNTTGTAFYDKFRFQMHGWGSEDIPLTYQFSYKRDGGDPLEAGTKLRSSFTERNFVRTVLPWGRQSPNYGVMVTGIVKSSMGVMVESNVVEVFVAPPATDQILIDFQKAMGNLDAETSLVHGIMISQVQPLAVSISSVLSAATEIITDKVFDKDLVANTPSIIADTAQFYSEVSTRGLRNNKIADNLENLTDMAVSSGFMDADENLQVGDPNVAHYLLAAADAMTPGIVSELLAGGRRRLETTDSIETRTTEEQLNQFVRMQNIQQRVGTAALSQLYPAENAANFSLRGCDMFLGKDYTDSDGVEPTQSVVVNTFALPTLEQLKTDFDRELYTFRYVLFKKFPYSFWAVPERHSLIKPEEDAGDGPVRIPGQGYGNSDRFWHAMTLDIGDEEGSLIPGEVQNTLENVSFDRLIKIDASAGKTLHSYATLDHAATCYSVWLDGTTLPHFDSRGLVYDQESCVSTVLKSFVVLIDDLPKEIESWESMSQGSTLKVNTDSPSTAAVGTLLLVLLAGIGSAAFGIYVDEKEHDKVPIDLSKKRIIDADDPLEKMLLTLAHTFRRNHLVLGLLVKHRKLTREKRILCIMVTGLAIQAVATVLHANTKVMFKSGAQFFATGLTAGVVVFPLTVFLQYLYEWRPMTRMHAVAPPRSAPPISLEHSSKQKELASAKSIFHPKRPPLTMKIRPPPKTAPPRVPLSSQLGLPVMVPGIPLDLPKLKVGDGKIAPPPPLQKLRPKPPKSPPPETEHLAGGPTSRTPPRTPFGGTMGSLTSPSLQSKIVPGTPPLGNTMDSQALSAPSDQLANTLGCSSGQFGNFGLTLPELPPLLQGDPTAVPGKKRPAPPPKKSSSGPRPPQAPPPSNKMFFAVPAGLALRHAGKATTPPFPPAKAKLQIQVAAPPADVLNILRSGGDSARSLAFPALSMGEVEPPRTIPYLPPPPPIMPKGSLFARGSAPMPPETPRDGSTVMRLPGAIEAPPSFRGADAESAEQQVRFSMEPEHTMAPPEPKHAPPPPRVPPRIDGKAKVPGIPDLPKVPGIGPSSSMVLAPLQLLSSETPVPPPPRADGRLAVCVPPQHPPEAAGQELVVCRDDLDPRMELALAPLRHLPGQGNVPALPREKPVSVPNMVLAKVPAIRRESGLLPPPPPPPVGGFGHLANSPLPPEEGNPIVVQKLVVWKEPPRRGGPTGKLPRPPPKLSTSSLRPTPPGGPPPSHAIVLARTAGVPSFDRRAIVKSSLPPPSVPSRPIEPHPDDLKQPALPPSFAGVVQKIAKNRDATIEGVDPFESAKKDPRGSITVGQIAHDEKAPPPIPDYLVMASLTAVQLFMASLILVFVAVITLWGTYLPPSAIYTTYAATLIGMCVNLGLFESVKCVVIACFALVHEETEKKNADMQARRLRMELKAQRVQQRGRRLVVN